MDDEEAELPALAPVAPPGFCPASVEAREALLELRLRLRGPEEAPAPVEGAAAAGLRREEAGGPLDAAVLPASERAAGAAEAEAVVNVGAGAGAAAVDFALFSLASATLGST